MTFFVKIKSYESSIYREGKENLAFTMSTEDTFDTFSELESFLESLSQDITEVEVIER